MSENTNPAPTGQPRDPGADSAQPGSAQPDSTLSAATLRTMEEQSDHLAEDIEEARQAVQAAHQADSMAPPGQEDFGAVDNAPVHGDGPVDPHDSDGEPEQS